jgi:hypothetical protein
MITNSARPTTRLFAVQCQQYRDATTPLDRWQRATESRDFYAVRIARAAIEGSEAFAEDVYCFHLFDRLDALHRLRYKRETAARDAEPANA